MNNWKIYIVPLDGACGWASGWACHQSNMTLGLIMNQHWCVVQVGRQLGLPPKQCEPMAVPFERYGNTSSSSTWYGAYIPFPLLCFPLPSFQDYYTAAALLPTCMWQATLCDTPDPGNLLLMASWAHGALPQCSKMHHTSI